MAQQRKTGQSIAITDAPGCKILKGNAPAFAFPFYIKHRAILFWIMSLTKRLVDS